MSEEAEVALRMCKKHDEEEVDLYAKPVRNRLVQYV